jgi:hypothetical protein
MSKFARSDEPRVNQIQKSPTSKYSEASEIYLCVIDLTFPCLRVAASAKAGILKFEFI